MITSISSISSAMIAKLICHPIDTIKSRLQVNEIVLNKMEKGLLISEAKHLLYKEGIRGFY